MTQQEKDYYLRLLPLHSYGRIFGEENVYIYTYYMYGDVIKQGDALQDYIEMVKAQRNCDKVNIVTMSMGTTILNAWLDNDRADYSSINRLINIVPIYQGCDLITDVFARDFNLTDQFVYQDYLPIVTKGFLENEYLGYLLNIAIKLLPQKTFERVLTRLTDAFVEALKNSSQMWSMITSDSYEKLADKYFSEPEYAKLRATTNEYYQSQRNLTANLNKLANDFGGKVFTICGYGLDYAVNKFSMMSIVSHNATANSDCLLDLSYSSLGATHADKGQKLSDEYINGIADKKYLSPDKTVDASTCQFPDTTWFFTDQSHWAFGNDVMINSVWLIMAGMIDDIYSSPECFPQFNGCRDTYNSTLILMYAAEKILANPAGYDAALVSELQKAFNGMRDIYNITNLNYKTSVSDAAAAMTKLQNALAALGVGSPVATPEVPKWGNFAKKTSKTVFKIYGPRGFFDFLNIANLFN